MRYLSQCLVILLVAVVFSGCSDVSPDKIMSSFEALTAQLAVDSLPAEMTDKELASKVDQLSKRKYDLNEKILDSPVETRLKNVLQTKDLNDVKKTFLTYELARCQMCEEKFDDARKSFTAAASLAESLNPSRPGLLGAIYYSFMVSLHFSGNEAEALKYRAKYNALVESEKNKKH